MTKCVEYKIGDEMKRARSRSIIHDDWSKNGVHYVGIFACYTRESTEITNKKVTQIPQLALLACSPIASLTKDNKDNRKEDDEQLA